MPYHEVMSKKKLDEYIQLRKPLDDYVKGLADELYSHKKSVPPPVILTTDRQVRNLRMELTKEKKRSFEREIVLLKEIDRLKNERDTAFYQMSVCLENRSLI